MTKILLVEDENEVREFFGQCLQSAGYEVLSAKNGADGLEIARKDRPDVIILDIMLPSINGLEVLEHIRKDQISTRIIMFTALGGTPTIVKAIKSGACDYLVKPCTPEEVINKVRRALAIERPLEYLKASIGASDGTKEADIYQEQVKLTTLSAQRNMIEPLLRRFVRQVLKSHLGNERWIDPILGVIPENERKYLQGVDKDRILQERLTLLNLITLIDTKWNSYFRILESGSKQERVTREQFKVLLESINAHREDAHAGQISDIDISAIQTAVTSIRKSIDRFLN